MADFRYVAKSMDGKIHRGAMEAAGGDTVVEIGPGKGRAPYSSF